MRKIHIVAMGSLLLAAPAAAQDWHPSFGVQAGFTRFKGTGMSGSGSYVDGYGIPEANIIGVYATTGAAFAIIPVSDKIAVEPALTFNQNSAAIPGLPATLMALGVRADYALTRQLYGALGLYSRYQGGASTGQYAHFQFGLEAAAGYRVHLAPQLEGRVEAQMVTVGKASHNIPYNLYSLLFGVSTSVENPRAHAAGRQPTTRPAPSAAAWRPMIGVSAGYSQVQISGGPGFTTLTFPGAGASSYAGITVAPSAPSLFVLLPVGDRLAAEVGMDVSDIRAGGSTVASIQIAPRMDLAVGRSWYAALGPTLHLVRNRNGAPAPTVGLGGVNAAWGYRFHLAGALAGRFELDYGATAGRRQTPSAINNKPTSAFGLTFGALMPLN